MIRAGAQVEPFVDEFDQATFVVVQDVRLVPPVALHPGPWVVKTEYPIPSWPLVRVTSDGLWAWGRQKFSISVV